MLTKSLSRADYNKEKKIVTPKNLERMGLQVPVRSHMLETTQSMANQIRKFIENKSQESHEISTYLAIEPALHEFQIKAQDLNKVLANREDEITYLKNEKEKNQKKIQNLDKHIFDLKTQTQKLQYEYKNTIDFLKSQNSAQKAHYIERISFLEQESKKFKEQYENLLKSARQVYEFRINSFSETKESYKLASQQVVKGLKKDISFHIRQYERLKEEISLNGKSTVDKLQYYEEQNYRLKQKLTEKQLEFGFFIMNNSTDMKAKDTLIQNLHKQFEAMLKNFQGQRQKFISEKDNLEEVRNEKEMTLNKTIINVLTQKRDLQSRLHENQLQINGIRYENEVLNRKCIEYSAKLQILELDKKAAIEKLEKEIMLLKADHQQKLERELTSFKRTHEQKVLFFKNDIEEKNHEITCLDDKISFLKKKIVTKNSIIKEFEESERKSFMQIQQKESEAENLKLEIQKLKRQNEIIRSGFEKQNRELKEAIEKQKQQQVERITKNFNTKVENLNREINGLRIRQNSENDHLPFSFSRIKFIQKNPSNFDARLSQISECQSEIHEQDMPLQEMRMTIQKQGEALLKNEDTINALHLELYKIKSQKVQKDVVINNLQKELKELQKEFGKVKNEAIRRYTELKQSSEEVCDKLDIENSKIAVKLQEALNEIESLKQKNQRLQKDYTNLQAENQRNLIQNASYKESIMKKQENSDKLIERLQTERIQGMNKFIQNLKNQNQTLRTIHQKNKESFHVLESKYSSMALNLKKKEVQIEELQSKQRANTKQILDLEGRVKAKEHIIQLLDQRLDDNGQEMFKTEAARLELEKQKQGLIEKLSSYELYSLQLRQLRIYDIKQVKQILDEKRLLKTAVEEKKIEVQNQINLRKELQNQIAEMQTQYENFKQQTILQTTRNILGQCRAQLEKESLILAEKHRVQHQQLLQKNAQLEEQIRLKQSQLKRVNKKLSQSEENVKQECLKLNSSQRKIEMYKKQLQKVYNQLQDSKGLLQVKQRLIITLKNELQDYHRKQKTLQRQIGLKKQPQIKGNMTQRVNKQQLEYLSPVEKIRQFRRVVDYFDAQRDKKYNQLGQEHRRVVDELTRVNGHIRDLSTGGMLNEIETLLREISRLKGHKLRLIDMLIRIQSENKSKGKRFQVIRSGIKESYRQFQILDRQVQQQIQKWRTITQSAVQLMKQQNPILSSDSSQMQSAQSDSIEQQIRTAADGNYLSRQVPIGNVISKDYVYDFDFQDDTIRKQSSKEEAEQTVQKKVAKPNVRYGGKEQKDISTSQRLNKND